MQMIEASYSLVQVLMNVFFSRVFVVMTLEIHDPTEFVQLRSSKFRAEVDYYLEGCRIEKLELWGAAWHLSQFGSDRYHS